MKVWIIYIFLFINLPIGLFFILPRFIKIREIECFSQYGNCNSEVSAKLDSLKGTNLEISKKNIKKILESEPVVKKYSLQFKIPAQLVVRVIERKPKFALVSSLSPKASLIDGEGRVLAVSEAVTIPSVHIDTSLPLPGENVSSNVLRALDISFVVAHTFPEYKNFWLYPDKLVVELQGLPNVIFPLENDKEVLLGSMVLILGRLKSGEFDSTIDKENIKFIDLRFRNPVLRQALDAT